ncbi:MAG: nuclear transport factor 2 family protein [Bacteroidota bacterium]
MNYLRATMTKGAKGADIERLLSLFTDNITHEHVRFGAKVSGKAQVRKGRLSHLEDYEGGQQETRVELTNLIVGFNFAVVEFREIFKARGKEKIEGRSTEER